MMPSIGSKFNDAVGMSLILITLIICFGRQAQALEIQSYPPTVSNGTVTPGDMKKVVQAFEKVKHSLRPPLGVRFINCTFEPGAWKVLFDGTKGEIQRFELYYCNLGDDDVRALSEGGRNLTGLHLNGHLVTDNTLKMLTGLCRLDSFSCAGTSLKGEGLNYVCNPESLTYLVLVKNSMQVSALEILKKFENLKDLSIFESKITARRFLQLPRFPHLEFLNCDLKNDPNGWFQVLIKQHMLNGPKGDGELDLRFTAFADSGLAHLDIPLSIKKLNLSHTAITDKSINRLSFTPALESLNLSHTRVSDQGIKDLRFEHLKSLDCSDSNIHGTGFVGFTQLVKLEIQHNTFSLADLKSITRLVNLKHLDLSGCRFPKTDNRLCDLKFTNLESLNLTGVTFIPSDVSIFENNKSLRFLTIDSGSIPAFIMEAISNCSQLDALSLKKAKHIDHRFLEHISKLTQLELLDLTGAKVSEKDVQWLHRQLPNCEILT